MVVRGRAGPTGRELFDILYRWPGLSVAFTGGVSRVVELFPRHRDQSVDDIGVDDECIPHAFLGDIGNEISDAVYGALQLLDDLAEALNRVDLSFARALD